MDTQEWKETYSSMSIHMRIKIDAVAMIYHEICRDMVNNQIGMITKPTRPYIEWNDLDDDMKAGRRFVAWNLMQHMKL